MTLVDAETGEVVEHEQTLDELEQVIEHGLESFLDVGNALLAIKVDRRYREAGYASFEDYCSKRWGISRRHGNRLVVAAATVEALSRDLDEETGPMGPTLPTTERDARPLGKLHSTEDQLEALAEADAVAEAEGRPRTSNDIEAAVQKRVERNSQSTTTETARTPADEEGADSDQRPAPSESDDAIGSKPVEQATKNAEDTDVAYRARLSSARKAALTLTKLDPERAAAVSLIDDRESDIHFIEMMTGWLDEFELALHRSQIRSVS